MAGTAVTVYGSLLFCVHRALSGMWVSLEGAMQHWQDVDLSPPPRSCVTLGMSLSLSCLQSLPRNSMKDNAQSFVCQPQQPVTKEPDTTMLLSPLSEVKA